jgi:hypothetical protein
MLILWFKTSSQGSGGVCGSLFRGRSCSLTSLPCLLSVAFWHDMTITVISGLLCMQDCFIRLSIIRAPRAAVR